MRLILPFIFVLLLLGCQRDKEAQFQAILQCFKKVSLPYKIEAGHGSDALLDSTFYHQHILASPIKWYQLHEQSELNIEALAPSHDNVNCGVLLYENEDFVVIDIQDTRIGFDRYLLVFSRNGELIDGIPVAHLSKGKNGDEAFDIEQFSKFEKNLEIKMTENIRHSYTNTSIDAEQTIKTAVYQIQADGKIKFLRK